MTYDTPTGEHPAIIQMRENVARCVAQGYTDGDVNHNLQPLIGVLRLRLRDIQEGRSIGPNALLSTADLEHHVEKMGLACDAEIAWLNRPLEVIELKNCGNHVGIFKTRVGAKAKAQELLDEYHVLYAEAETDPDDDPTSYEPLITDTLEWAVRRIDHRGLMTGLPDWGWERECALYSEQNGYFTLHEVTVGE